MASSKKSFSGKKLKVIELLALGEMTQAAISKEVGCQPACITKYKKDPKFMEAVVNRSRQLLKDNLPEIYKALTDKSKEGKDRHIKIFLEHLEKLEEAKAGQSTITFTWKRKEQ